MRSVEAIVVGGGPAGSAAAQCLRAAGRDVLVLDKERFPRLKLCAGWITPDVVRDLRLEIADYPHGFLSFRRLHWHLRGLRLPVPCVQHSIRRVEFDAWLLERSGAEVVHHGVRDIVRDGEYFLIDGEFRCRYLIGAGGTSCPVRRTLFDAVLPRARALQTVTLELEFPYEWRDPDCHLWFFDHGLPGYSWYVPKAHGWLNVGVGAMAVRLKQRGENVRQHWQNLASKLLRQFGIPMPDDPTGYSYYVRGPLEPARLGNAFITGDAAGLATRDLCEGIGPAIRSGQRAAQSLLSGAPYRLDGVTGASLGGGLVSRGMDWAFTRGH
ncbi:MAG: FAD-dependent monooxygenase [Pseudomonadota bacterium]|nr:FAD-dependent monooxygenase [Pseudomonadota bacterium]